MSHFWSPLVTLFVVLPLSHSSCCGFSPVVLSWWRVVFRFCRSSAFLASQFSIMYVALVKNKFTCFGSCATTIAPSCVMTGRICVTLFQRQMHTLFCTFFYPLTGNFSILGTWWCAIKWKRLFLYGLNKGLGLHRLRCGMERQKTFFLSYKSASRCRQITLSSRIKYILWLLIFW